MDYFYAFLVGGVICALVQILMEKTKMLPGRIMVLLVCPSSVYSAGMNPLRNGREPEQAFPYLALAMC